MIATGLVDGVSVRIQSVLSARCNAGVTRQSTGDRTDVARQRRIDDLRQSSRGAGASGHTLLRLLQIDADELRSVATEPPLVRDELLPLTASLHRATFHSRIFRSAPAEASILPSEEKATA